MAGVPEPLGIDGEVEHLRLLPGAAGAECWPRQATEHGLRSAARLLRAAHDASRSFVPPRGAVWNVAGEAGSEGTICHGDPGPWNMTWDGNTATGLFDWDLAHPAPAMDNVVIARQLRTVEQVRTLAERGVQPQRDWVADGHLDVLRARVRWSQANRALVG